MANFEDRISALGMSESEFRQIDEALTAAGMSWGSIGRFIPCLIDLIGCLRPGSNREQCFARFAECVLGKLDER